MKKNRKKLIAVILPAVLLATAAVWFFVSGNRDKRDVPDEEFLYDSVNPACNYSEHVVLYFDGDGILHMIDTASGKDMVYCDRPNCIHEGYSGRNPNPSCPAAFRSMCAGGVLFHRHLYCIGNLSEEDTLKTQYLYEMDANGENRRKIATLNNVQLVRFVLYRDHYVIGGYCNSCEIDENGQIINDNADAAGVFVIDLENHKVQMGNVHKDGQADISGIYYEAGSVYYLSGHFGDEVTELMISEGMEKDYETFLYDHLVEELYRYDIKTQETTLVKSFRQLSSIHFLEGDVLYNTKEGFFLYDRRSGKTEKLPIENDARGIYGSKDSLYFCRFPGNNEAIYYRYANGKVEELLRTAAAESIAIASIRGDTMYIGYYDNGSYCLGAVSLREFNQGIFNVKRLRYYNE